MNNIPQLENESRQIERLAAQRELYSFAKILFGLQLCVTMFIPIVLATCSFIWHEVTTIGAILGFLLILVDMLFVLPGISKTKKQAASIQELFDCYVLSQEPSPLKTFNISHEDVLTHYHTHEKRAGAIEKLYNWYDVEVGTLNLPIARIICQRANIRWDRDLRQRICIFLRLLLFTVTVVVILISCLAGKTVVDTLLIFCSLIPFFSISIKELNDHKDAVERLENIKLFLEVIWHEITHKTIDCNSLQLKSRIIQDALFEHRVKSPLIFDYIYDRYKSKDENLMKKGTISLVQEITDNNLDCK